MDWLNENSGVVALVAAILTVAMLGLCLFLIFDLRGRIAVQRLKFLGFYSTELDSRRNYAEIMIGNKSLNDMGISELGIKNGKTSFNLTSLYREKAGLAGDARIVIEQRSAIRFCLTVEELKKVLMDGRNGRKVLRTIKVYAVDNTGTLYKGKVNSVKKLLKDVTAAEKRGEWLTPPSAPKAPAPRAEEEVQPQQEPSQES